MQDDFSELSDWSDDKCRPGYLSLCALTCVSQEKHCVFHAVMSSSVPLATFSAPPGGQSGPSALPEQPPSNPSPTQAELVTNPNAESSAMVASAVADDQSSATATRSAIEKADRQPWR